MADLSNEELAELERMETSMEPAPWSVTALSSAIRHIQRNTDIMEMAQEYAEEPDASANTPGRYDGGPLAHIRNVLPSLLAELRRRRAGDSDGH